MRLIDADALKDTICSNVYPVTDDFNNQDYGMHWTGGIEKVIDEQPTIEKRNVGYWKKVTGYVTPGGDPVWACSECGKGIHVYGIEHSSYGRDIADGQWVACPNCGAEMLGEIWTK